MVQAMIGTHIRPIILVTGKIGAGKTTVANYLVERHGFKRVRFAQGLKDMLRAIGLNEREVDGDLKETPCELLGGKTPRHAMQTLGTEWGRVCVDADLWTRSWRRAVEALPDYVGAVADDARFANEYRVGKEASAKCIVIRVLRDVAGDAKRDSHISEEYQMPADYVIDNTGPLVELNARLDAIVSAWK